MFWKPRSLKSRFCKGPRESPSGVGCRECSHSCGQPPHNPFSSNWTSKSETGITIAGEDEQIVEKRNSHLPLCLTLFLGDVPLSTRRFVYTVQRLQTSLPRIRTPYALTTAANQRSVLLSNTDIVAARYFLCPSALMTDQTPSRTPNIRSSNPKLVSQTSCVTLPRGEQVSPHNMKTTRVVRLSHGKLTASSLLITLSI